MVGENRSEAGKCALALSERVRDFYREMPGAIAGREEAIHDLRVAGRRLRVALAALAQRPEGRRNRRASRLVKQLIDAAGASRDTDICLSLLNRLRPEATVNGTAALLRRRLLSTRSRSRRRMVETFLDFPLRALRRELAGVVERGGEDPPLAAARLKSRADQIGAEMLQALDTLGEQCEPPALHTVRRNVRRLRYVIEVLARLAGEETPGTARLRDLQEDLGELNDAWVLSGWLQSQEEAAVKRGQAEVAQQAGALHEQALKAVSDRHRRFLDRDPKRMIAEVLQESDRLAVQAWTC